MALPFVDRLMLRGSLAAFAHGVFPCIMTTNASSRLRELYGRIEHREGSGTINRT